jgi:hypothetical protein
MFQCYVVTHYLLWQHPSVCPHIWHSAVLTAFHDARFCTAVTCYYGRLTESSYLSIYYHIHPRYLPNNLSCRWRCINTANQIIAHFQTNKIYSQKQTVSAQFLMGKDISATGIQKWLYANRDVLLQMTIPVLRYAMDIKSPIRRKSFSFTDTLTYVTFVPWWQRKPAPCIPPHPVQQLLLGRDVLFIEATRSHSDTPHSVGMISPTHRPLPENKQHWQEISMPLRYSNPQIPARKWPQTQYSSGGMGKNTSRKPLVYGLLLCHYVPELLAVTNKTTT